MRSYGKWFSIDTNSTTASMYLHIRNASALQTVDVTWKDPTDDMISKLNELIFRLAVATSGQGISSSISGKTADPAGRDELVLSPNLAGSNRTTQQQASMSMVYEHTVYSVQRRWLSAAIVLISLVCLSIFWTYWGWWELGRPVSLDPLETAKAFDAPLLHDADENGTANEICDTVGTKRVVYGPEEPPVDWQHAGDTEMESMNGSISLRPLSPRNPAPVGVSITHRTPSSVEEDGVLVDNPGVSGPDAAVSSQTRDVDNSANPHSIGPSSSIPVGDHHTTADGPTTAFTTTTPSTSSLIPRLKFREQSNTI